MKKEVENKKPFITDLSSSESSSDESEKEIPIEKYLLTDEKPKKTPSKKSKKVDKKRESSSSNSDDQEKSVKPIKPIKPKKISTPRLLPKKTLVKEEDLKRLQKKAKKLGAASLDYSKRKNKKYVVEYNGKKIHFGSINTEDYITHRYRDRRDKYLTKAMKITNKDGEWTYQFPSYPNYWSIKLLN